MKPTYMLMLALDLSPEVSTIQVQLRLFLITL